MEYRWDFWFIWHYVPALLNGVAVTLELSVIAVAIGTAAGVLFAVLRGSRITILRWFAICFVETGLALPLAVLLIWINYCLPQVSSLFTFNSFTVAALALAINLTPFVCETIRSGFATLPEDYALAARAIGMSDWQAFVRVTFPLSLRRTLPGLIAHYVTTLKMVSICSIIAVPEILHTSSTIISNEFRPLEVYTTMAVLYLLMVLPFTIFARVLERHFLVRN
jgi:polar amino acid transport system permease protein